MLNKKPDWQKDLQQQLRIYYPTHGKLGRDTIQGLVVAILEHKVDFIPHLGDVDQFDGIMIEAQLMADYLKHKYPIKTLTRKSNTNA